MSWTLPLLPRTSGKLIASLAKNVFIEKEGVKILACEILEGLKNKTIDINNFSQHELHPTPDDPKAIDWIFVLDTLNFSFWQDKSKSYWRVNGQTGYFGLCAAIKRAIEAGTPITDPKFYSKISRNDLQSILQGDDSNVTIPLLDERVKCLHQVGQVLLEEYNGTFQECVKLSNGSSETLLKLVVKEFECFRDEAEYYGNKVSFYKRAQILVGDIWACFEGKGMGSFDDIDYITMFADYRVPQVLVHFGTMRYSNVLLSTLQSGTVLEAGSNEEVEIRGCSIEVVEQVVEEVKNIIKQHQTLGMKVTECNSILVDHFLWDYRRKHAAELETIPYHKVRTIYY